MAVSFSSGFLLSLSPALRELVQHPAFVSFLGSVIVGLISVAAREAVALFKFWLRERRERKKRLGPPPE